MSVHAGDIVELEPAALNDEQLRANRFDLVSSLADDLAHEVRNPLNAIVINLEVLKVRVDRGDTAGAMSRAAVIEEEVQRLHDIIDSAIQLLRPDQDTGGSFALDQLFDELIPLISARVRHARNTLLVSCASGVFVDVPRNELRFAVINLLMAVHARMGDDGGALSLVCDGGRDEIRIIIDVEPGAHLSGEDASYGQSLGVAAALLRVCGGRIEPKPRGVLVLLPRSSGRGDASA